MKLTMMRIVPMTVGALMCVLLTVWALPSRAASDALKSEAKQSTTVKTAAVANSKVQGSVDRRPSGDQVLVRVNGVDITRRQLDRHVDMMVALLKNRRKNTPPELVVRFKKKNLRALSNELFQRTVIKTCLANSNVTVTADAKKAVERECLRNFGRKKQTLDELRAIISKAGFGKEFEEGMSFDVRFRSFITTVHSNVYYVSQERLDKVRAGMLAYNQRADATNRLTLARAEGVLKRIRAGEDFKKLADAFSEDAEKKPGGDLGDCDESDFPEEKHIWRKLWSMKAGEVTDVLEMEEGYVIFKVVRRNTVEQSQTGGESLTLARIFFRQAYRYPSQSDDELRVDVEREVHEKLYADIYRAFRAQSQVIYPNGHVKAK